jgi:RNA polymerase alpha subunit
MPQTVNEYLVSPVEELPISTRAINGLVRADIKYIGELVQRTERDLLAIKEFELKSLSEVKEVLSDLGLSLGMSLPDCPSRQQLDVMWAKGAPQVTKPLRNRMSRQEFIPPEPGWELFGINHDGSLFTTPVVAWHIEVGSCDHHPDNRHYHVVALAAEGFNSNCEAFAGYRDPKGRIFDETHQSYQDEAELLAAFQHRAQLLNGAGELQSHVAAEPLTKAEIDRLSEEACKGKSQ